MKKLDKSEVAEIQVSYKPAISEKPIIASCVDAYNVIKDFIPKDKIALKEYIVVLIIHYHNFKTLIVESGVMYDIIDYLSITPLINIL